MKGTKTGRARYVDLVEPLSDDLEQLRRERGGDLVAPNRRGGCLDLHVWRRRVWKAACERAGVQASPYDGRHTFASLLANEGRLPIEVANQLGHTTSKTSDRYSHLFRPGALARRTPMVAAILEARAEVAADAPVASELDELRERPRRFRVVEGGNPDGKRRAAMERTGIEPVTPSLQSWCSPS